MEFFALEPAGELNVYLPQQELYGELNAKGISVATARDVFEAAFGLDGPVFTLISSKGSLLPENATSTDDLLVWNWIPIFSERARELLLSLGAMPGDFARCTVGAEPRHLHLPRACLDVVDFERSTFGHFLPVCVDESLPFRIEALALKDMASQEQMPGVFRPVNRLGQEFSELVVTGSLRSKWTLERLSSARFRPLN